VESILRNPKISIVTDDGRRWLRHNPEKKFDAVVSNTTWNFRANATNLLSVEFLELVRPHLNPGGSFFYNTTDSPRVQRTACSVFPYGARFTKSYGGVRLADRLEFFTLASSSGGLRY
jgi:spermidine synthase